MEDQSRRRAIVVSPPQIVALPDFKLEVHVLGRLIDCLEEGMVVVIYLGSNYLGVNPIPEVDSTIDVLFNAPNAQNNNQPRFSRLL